MLRRALGSARNVLLLVDGKVVPVVSKARSRKYRPLRGNCVIVSFSTTSPSADDSV